MQEIGGIINRLLNRKLETPREEKDYQAAWDEIMSGKTRKHCSVSWNNGRLYITVDNPVTRHQVNMRRDEIKREYLQLNLPLREIIIRIR